MPPKASEVTNQCTPRHFRGILYVRRVLGRRALRVVVEGVEEFCALFSERFAPGIFANMSSVTHCTLTRHVELNPMVAFLCHAMSPL